LNFKARKIRKKMQTQVIAVTIAICAFSAGIFKEALFPSVLTSQSIPASKPTPAPEPTPASEPIPDSEKNVIGTLASADEPIPAPEPIPEPEPIPDSEKNAIGTLASADEMESAPSWEFQRSIPADDQNLWTVLGPLSSILICILTSLMMDYLIHHKFRRCWRKEDGIKQRIIELRLLSHECRGLMSEWKNMLALVKEEEDHSFAQFNKEVRSMKKMMKVKDKRCYEFLNEINSMKIRIKGHGQGHVQFQNALDSAKMMMKMEKKCHMKCWDEMDSIMATERKC
jgi:hypothetical protein